jgi:hypothetical protein
MRPVDISWPSLERHDLEGEAAQCSLGSVLYLAKSERSSGQKTQTADWAAGYKLLDCVWSNLIASRSSAARS